MLFVLMVKVALMGIAIFLFVFFKLTSVHNFAGV
jgi:hypothetical protein